MLKIGVHGASGRMGQEILGLIFKEPASYQLEFAVAKRVGVAPLAPTMTYINCLPATSEVQVLIDFSSPHALDSVVDWCVEHKVALVIGTTGYSPAQKEKMQAAALQIPLLLAANTSLSVTILTKVAALVAAALPQAEVEICETHHRYKKDAPSGTALRLGEAVASARKHDLAQVANFNRQGNHNQQRAPAEIGFAVMRGGDVVGRHAVSFFIDGEELTLASDITNRTSFAAGALLAARFLANQQPGFYSMDDALELHYLPSTA